MIPRRRIKILNCPIDILTMDETVRIVDEAIENNRRIIHSCVDAGKIALMQANKELYDSVILSDIINCDGQLLVWISRITSNPLPERVVGIELFQNLIKLAQKKRYKIYLLGAKKEIIKKVVEIISDAYSSDIIVGYRDGYFNEDEEVKIAKQIALSSAHMLFVGISSPKKEIFLHKYREILKDINFKMGVGGGFDVIAGKIKRAPLCMQKMCLEWFYRFIKEPRAKWKIEVVDSFHFLFLFLKEKFLRRSDNNLQ